MVETVRVGFIGAGGFSRSRLIPNLKQIPGVELVAVANSTPESSARVASEFGFQRAAADWRAVVEAPDVDAIVLGTRTDMHSAMIPSILDGGKHLLSMNALARTAEEAHAMVAAARHNADRVTFVYPAAVGPFYLVEDDLVRSLSGRRLRRRHPAGDRLLVHPVLWPRQYVHARCQLARRAHTCFRLSEESGRAPIRGPARPPRHAAGQRGAGGAE